MVKSFHARIANVEHAVALMMVWTFNVAVALRSRWDRTVSTGDSGSETTEKAVITAIGLGLAIGLGAAITAAVQHYQSQIH